MTMVSVISGSTNLSELTAYCDCAVAIALLGFSPVFPPLFGFICLAITAFLPDLKGLLLPVITVWVVTVDVFFRIRKRFSSVRPLFRNDAVWKGLEEMSCFISSLLLSDDVILMLVSDSLSCHVVKIVAALIALVLYILTFIMYFRGRTVLLSMETQEEILTLARGCLRPHEYDPDTEDKRMTALYKRVLEYMEEKKPYLEEDISLEQFSRHVYSNKTYLSKTINVMSGHNYRQFMNYYRVEHAISLLKNDPSIRMEDVALMSGFHNVVSFNMAFRLFMSETPSEWMRLNHIKG